LILALAAVEIFPIPREKVIAAIKGALEGIEGEGIGSIRCIGLGNFNLPGQHHNSLYQLALLESVMEEFRVDTGSLVLQSQMNSSPIQ